MVHFEQEPYFLGSVSGPLILATSYLGEIETAPLAAARRTPSPWYHVGHGLNSLEPTWDCTSKQGVLTPAHVSHLLLWLVRVIINDFPIGMVCVFMWWLPLDRNHGSGWSIGSLIVFSSSQIVCGTATLIMTTFACYVAASCCQRWPCLQSCRRDTTG